jgi:hypothetical protein
MISLVSPEHSFEKFCRRMFGKAPMEVIESASAEITYAHRNHQERTKEADFVRQDAAAVGEPLQCEDHRVYLMWVRINAALALRGSIPLLFIRSSQTNKLLGKIPALDGMRNNHRQTSKLLQWAV